MPEGLMYDPEQETLTQPEMIFETVESRIIIPEKPLVPANEGTHLRILPKSEKAPYFTEDLQIKDSLKTFMAALASARAMFGDPKNPDEYYLWNQWVNVHLVPRFGGKEQYQIEVIGRNARGDTWAKPIEYPKSEEFDQVPIVKEEKEMLARELPEKVAEVEDESVEVTLFNQPEVTPEKVDQNMIFKFANYEVRAARKNPHVEEGGLHMWVHAYTNENYEGVQSNVKNGVEQFIVAQAVSKAVYKHLGVPIEIHFSGNWGLPSQFQQEEAVAKGKDPDINYYKENLSAHANLYGAPPETDRVDLPERPGFERPEIPTETREKLTRALETELPALIQPFIGKKLTEAYS